MWLGISTATGHLGLALVAEEGPVAELITAVGLEHSEAMFLLLEAIFDLSGTSKSQLQGLGVAVGPGGFTGVRSGVALAKACALGLGLPAYGVGTLAALAWPHLGPGRVVASLLDGRRGLVFVGAFGPDGGALMAEALMPLPEAVQALQGVMGWASGASDRDGTLPGAGSVADPVTGAGPFPGGLVLVGEGVEAHRAALAEALPGAWQPPAEGMLLRPASVAAIARQRQAAGQLPGPDELNPRYLREPKAVVEWEAAQGRQGQAP